LGRVAFVLALACIASTGCDGAEPDPDDAIRAEPFVDGVHKDTEGGAFRIALFARDGLQPGPNQLIVRVGFHDPGDPDGLGVGVPAAIVHLDAFALDGSAQQLDLEASYLSDGRYLIDDLALSASDWSFELRIEAGATIDESVAFAFVVE
jgi:hypothetical protein